MIFLRPLLAQYSAEVKKLTSVKLMTFMTSVSRSVLLRTHYICTASNMVYSGVGSFIQYAWALGFSGFGAPCLKNNETYLKITKSKQASNCPLCSNMLGQVTRKGDISRRAMMGELQKHRCYWLLVLNLFVLEYSRFLDYSMQKDAR